MKRDSGPRPRGGARKNERRTDFARRALSLLAAAALLNLTAAGGAAAARAPRPAPTGQVSLAGGLTVDGSPALAGQTVFTGSTYGAEEGSRPSLELGNRARLELEGGTALRLDFTDATVGGALDAGGARLSVPREVSAAFETADASVVNDASAPALFSLSVSKEGTTLAVWAGRVEMRAGGATRVAGAGESLRASKGSQPSPQQGRSLSSRQRAGLYVGIAAAVAAVILIITGRGDDEVPEEPCIVPIFISPTDFPPC